MYTSCGMKNVVLKKNFYCVKKKDGTLACEESSIIAGLCGEVYLIAYRKKNLLGYGETYYL